MKLTGKAPDPLSLGFFVEFSLTHDSKWKVDIQGDFPSRRRVSIELPDCQRDKWLAGLNSILRRLQYSFTLPIRVDYDNVTQFFTLDQLRALERWNPTYSLSVYEVPARLLASERSQLLDIDQIKLNDRRRVYAEERAKRNQHVAEQMAT